MAADEQFVQDLLNALLDNIERLKDFWQPVYDTAQEVRPEQPDPNNEEAALFLNGMADAVLERSSPMYIKRTPPA